MTLAKQTPSKAGRTKTAKARRALTKDQLFFYEHAGYGHDPKTQTAEQGRVEYAIALALAEEQAKGLGWEFEWTNDWGVGSHKDYYGAGSCYEDSEPNTCEFCVCKDENGETLASLGCIDDATRDYRRVVEAELASEALAEYDHETEVLDAH